MTRVWRLLRGLRLRVTWIAVGWAGAFGMAMFGSKLHGWLTRSGISLDKRARMDTDDRFDWMPTDMRSKD